MAVAAAALAGQDRKIASLEEELRTTPEVAGTAQERYDSGPWKGFLVETPALNLVLIAKPYRVRAVHGIISCGDGRPLPAAAFEIRDRLGQVKTARTDERGAFTIPYVAPGKYAFKVTLDGFHPVGGIVVVSRWASRQRAVLVQLQLGA